MDVWSKATGTALTLFVAFGLVIKFTPGEFDDRPVFNTFTVAGELVSAAVATVGIIGMIWSS